MINKHATGREYRARYNSPQGLLPGEHNRDGWHRDEAGDLYDPDGEMVRQGESMDVPNR